MVLYYETYYYDMYEEDTNDTYYCELAEDRAGLVGLSLLAGLCITWILTSASITLLAVLRAQIERQKKQLIGSLVAVLYNALFGLPSTLLQLYKKDLSDDFRWCILSFGIADLGTLMLAFSASLIFCIGYLSLKDPLRSHIFEDAENKIVAFQFTIPGLLILTLMVVNVSFGFREDECCSWSYLPNWYFIPEIVALLTSIAVGNGFATGMLCIARKQAIAINTIEMHSEDPQYLKRNKKRKAKQDKYFKLNAFLFTITMTPSILAIVLDLLVDTIDLGDLTFYGIYISLVTIGSSMPVMYSYAFAGVRFQLKSLMGQIRR